MATTITEATVRNLIAFTAVTAIAAITLCCHELWRDELQAYSIARYSHTMAELFSNKAYEGHPVLWYVILYALTHITTSLFAMQLLHLLIALCGIGLFLHFFPGKPWVKYLTVFGYFFLYEYTVISRNYGIEITLVVGLLAAIQHQRWWLSTVLLFLLLQTNALGCLIGCALFPVMLALQWPNHKKQAIVTAACFTFAIVFFWITVHPPADSGFSPGWTFNWRDLQNACMAFWDVFVPLPKAQLHSWNSNFLSSAYHPWLKTALALGLLGAACYTLRSGKFALLFFASAVLLITAFLTTKYLGFLRHQGHYFLAYIIALWLRDGFAGHGALRQNAFSNLFTGTLLSAQVAGGLIACYMDWQYPFSNSQAVATYISRKSPDAFLVASPDYIGASVGIILNREVYYPCSDRSGLFIIWDDKRLDLSEGMMISRTGNKKAQGNDVLLLSGSLLQQTDSLNAYGLMIIDSFPPTIVKNEQYFIYR